MLESAPLWPALVASATTGLLGSVHCVGMCGVGLGALLAPRTTTQTSDRGGINLAFNAGRVVSYTAAGALIGGLAAGLGQALVMGEVMPLRLAMYVLGHSLIIASGLTLGGWMSLFAPIERIGHRLWRVIAPLTRRWCQPQHPGQGFVLGTLWGWIPCGLVYAALATAASVAGGAGSADGFVSAALVMFAFGLGTLPAMLTVGSLASSLQRLTRHRRVRQTAGAMVIALGVLGLSRLPQMADFAAFARLCMGST